MTSPVRIGVRLPDAPFEEAAALAAAAERAGFGSVWVRDLLPPGPGVEPYTLLSALAARTSTARLGVLSSLPGRNPAILAKQGTTLDVVSRGRALVGFAAPAGADDGATRLDEALQVCRAVLRDERPTFEGRFYRIRDAVNHPPPVQTGGPPIIVACREPLLLDVAARRADAVVLEGAPEELRGTVAMLAARCADAGRDPAALTTIWLAGAARVVAGEVAAAVAAGVDGVIIDASPHGAGPAALAAAGETLRDAFRRAV